MTVLSTFGQTKDTGTYDCSNYIDTFIDKAKGDTSIVAKNYLTAFQSNKEVTGFEILMIKGDNYEILLDILIGGGNCIDKGHKMNVLFRDGSRLVLENMKDFNCDPRFYKFFDDESLDKKAIKKFITKEIKTMEIETYAYEGYVEVNFSSKKSKKFRKTFKCLIEH